MRYINSRIPIAEVARTLDLRLDGRVKIHCWHPDRHKNGDRTASVGIRVANNSVKCFGCDLGPVGPIDLVMNVRQIGAADAALWISARFGVPTIPAGKRLEEPERWRGRFGYDHGLGLLVRSGLWGQLSEAARSIAPVLLEMADREENNGQKLPIQISYVGMSRYSGIRSPNAVRKAVVELGELGFLLCPEAGLRRSPSRQAAKYIVTPSSEALVENANAFSAQLRSEIEAERELRDRRRKERIRVTSGAKAALLNSAEPKDSTTVPVPDNVILASAEENIAGRRVGTKYKTLYSTDSANQQDAIQRIARSSTNQPATDAEARN